MPISKTKKITGENPTDGKIVVTAQQTRFVEIDDPSSKDIDIRDLSIAIGGRDIVDHTKLVIKAGLRYAFVGRNGLGKSTVLKALAERRIPGVASNLRILLLGQTLIEDGHESESIGPPQSQTVIEHVMTSDKLRLRLLKDANCKYV